MLLRWSGFGRARGDGEGHGAFNPTRTTRAIELGDHGAHGAVERKRRSISRLRALIKIGELPPLVVVTEEHRTELAMCYDQY
jgi:hypothetical protein